MRCGHLCAMCALPCRFFLSILFSMGWHCVTRDGCLLCSSKQSDHRRSAMHFGECVCWTIRPIVGCLVDTGPDKGRLRQPEHIATTSVQYCLGPFLMDEECTSNAKQMCRCLVHKQMIYFQSFFLVEKKCGSSSSKANSAVLQK